MNKDEKKASQCKSNAQKVSTFLKKREITIAEDIPNQGEISIRQELFSDSVSSIDQDDYVDQQEESLLQIIHRIAGRNTANINQPPTGEESSTREEPYSGERFSEESGRYFEPKI